MRGFVNPFGIIMLPLFVTLKPSRADCHQQNKSQNWVRVTNTATNLAKENLHSTHIDVIFNKNYHLLVETIQLLINRTDGRHLRAWEWQWSVWVMNTVDECTEVSKKVPEFGKELWYLQADWCTVEWTGDVTFAITLSEVLYFAKTNSSDDDTASLILVTRTP